MSRHRSGPRYEFHGFAIVGDDGMIADADGRTPAALRNDADWAYFQDWLDRAAVTVLGRLGHERNPNPKQRRRLVLSRAAGGLERRDDAWWWNPAIVALDDALAAAAPSGGIVAVPGGRQIFDLFLEIGFDAFHLSRVAGVRAPGGVPCFSALRSDGPSIDDLLAAHGLRRAPPVPLDAANTVTLHIFRRERDGSDPPA